MRRLKKTARWLLAWLLILSGAMAWARRRLVRRRARLVLTFHRVLPRELLASTHSPAGMVVSRESYRELILYLKQHYELVPLEAKIEELGQKGRLRLPVSITFDDGWVDNVDALEITRAAGVPATVFLVTGRMGEAFPFWPERVEWIWRKAASQPGTAGEFTAILQRGGVEWSPMQGMDALLEKLKRCEAVERGRILEGLEAAFWMLDAAAREEPLAATLSWNDTRLLARKGVAFGSHTVTHPLLDQAGNVHEELERSRRQVEEELGTGCTAVAYPNGNWNEGVRSAAAAVGYRLGFTQEQAAWMPACDPLRAPRFNINQSKITGPAGGFSGAVFEYCVTWKALRGALL